MVHHETRHCSSGSRQTPIRDTRDRDSGETCRALGHTNRVGEHWRPGIQGRSTADMDKKIVTNALKEDATFGYSPTKGLDETCAYIACERNLERGIQITPDDILFFNGLGDGISHLYRNLNPRARILTRPRLPDALVCRSGAFGQAAHHLSS